MMNPMMMGGMGGMGMMNPMMQMMQQNPAAAGAASAASIDDAAAQDEESAYGSYGGPLQPGLGQVPRHNVNTPKPQSGPQRSAQRAPSSYKPY